MTIREVPGADEANVADDAPFSPGFAPSLPGPIIFADRTSTRHRRREDLVDIVLAAIGICGVWIIGVFANATTQGVTQDVLQFQLIREVLLLPVTFIEGLVVLAAPIGIVVALALRRRLSTIIRAVGTGLTATLGGWALVYGLSFLPPEFTAPLRMSQVTQANAPAESVIGINVLVITLCAFFTAAGEIDHMRTVRWSWAGLWVVLFLGVMRSTMTLPGAFICVFIGRLFGCLTRWIYGFDDRRATGIDLVNALLSLSIIPSRIIRTDLPTDEDPLQTWLIDNEIVGSPAPSPVSAPLDEEDITGDEDEAAASPPQIPVSSVPRVDVRNTLVQRPYDAGDTEFTVTRRPHPNGNRHYQVWDFRGELLDLVVVDPGRELTGTLRDVWNNIRLRGISRWVSPSLKARVERATLTSLSAGRAHVRTPDMIGVAQAGDSLVSVSRALPPTTRLYDLSDEQITDAMLDEAWLQLKSAHTHAIAHRYLTEDALVVDQAGDVWLINWEQGEVATTDLSRRIDVAQMLTLLAVASSPDRALASARRCLDGHTLASAAPVLQAPILPSSINQEIRRSELLTELRSRLLEEPEASSEELAKIQRFQPRTVVTVGILFLALVVVLGSLNFDEIVTAVTAANPVWMAISFALAALTWVGAAIALRALSTVKLPFAEAFTAQVAASIVTIVAPAGVGPAALNMRYLRQKKIPTALAVATVTIQQLAQLTITVSLLLIVMVVSGASLSVSLPFGMILAIVAGIGIVVGGALLVPKIRRWVWEKIEPTWQQVFPRLLWIGGQPRRILAVVAGNIIMNIGFIGSFWAALTAMGGSLDFASLAITYLASNSLGSVIPSPGGIGPVETALTAGLQVAGVSLSIGLPTAILYRLVTFYGRIPFGWLAMKWMEKRNLI
ncbi:lysylphosphatidylglycerol synthase transmembrane domain-containing protein [Schaalia sp. ZJ405]|uniref:lysylphosphatidylglycerol synthase transmembrane domain-containing protein n=1 Tax=Schaalia sp. ZJ405 TaxID=2709403 RepID=UPI001E42798A|nr:lysylphosphatidylglycerol synthase transmembrane domain-containing protein [Schaalia sp. ZJ405]